jgi:hypothetical protein
MTKLLIAMGAILPMLLVLMPTPHSATANGPVEVWLGTCSGVQAVPAGAQVTVFGRWGAKNEGLIRAWLTAADVTFSVNGEPLPDANNLWSPPYKEDGVARTMWAVTLDPLASGESYTLQWTWGLTHPVIDGYDYDGVRGPDRFGPGVAFEGACTLTAS